jgi:hypothetical protein
MRLCAELFSLVLFSKGMGEDSRNLKFRENFRGRVVSCVGRLVPKGTFRKFIRRKVIAREISGIVGICDCVVAVSATQYVFSYFFYRKLYKANESMQWL